MISLSRSQNASSSAGDRRLAVHAHEERLDHERPHARGGRDVVENLAERDRRALDEVIVLVGARFELGPDFAVVLVENCQAALDVRAVEHAGVGDENHLDVDRGRLLALHVRRTLLAIISSKFLYVVGSPSPEKAMSLSRRRCGGTSRNFSVS